jgi:hypothetical protein
MIILLKLKFIFSILLICCLFLPLSQCSYTTETSQQPSVEVKYVFQSTHDIESWLTAAALLAPFFVLLGTFRSKHKIKSTLTIFFLSFVAWLILFNETLFAEKLLIGGYVGFISSFALIVLCALELVINLRDHLIAKRDRSGGVV